MHSLLGRLTRSHLLVSLGAMLMVAFVSPPLFRQYYLHAEQQRLETAARGIARAAQSLYRSSRDPATVDVLIETSAGVIGGDVSLRLGSSRWGVTGPAVPAGTPRVSVDLSLSPSGPFITISKPLTDWAQIRRAQNGGTAFAALLGVLLALVLAYVSARALSQPLVAMSDAARRLADGDFSITVPETGPAEVRTLAASMNHMARSLASLDQLRRDFVANASHELRAPLTCVQGFLQAVLDGTASTEAERQHCLQTAADEARRMSRLVEDLLQLSRLQAGVLEFERVEGDLRALAERVIATMQPRLGEKNLRVKLEADDLPPIRMDQERLAQVLVNLIDNAIRYSPASGTIAVRLEGPDSIRPAVRNA